MLILNAARKSIGLKAGLTEARMEIQDLIEDYELQTKRLERVNDLIKELCQQIRYADKLLEIKGIGITTVAGFIAEVGDITRFDSAKELQKLAGLIPPGKESIKKDAVASSRQELFPDPCW